MAYLCRRSWNLFVRRKPEDRYPRFFDYQNVVEG